MVLTFDRAAAWVLTATCPVRLIRQVGVNRDFAENQHDLKRTIAAHESVLMRSVYIHGGRRLLLRICLLDFFPLFYSWRNLMQNNTAFLIVVAENVGLGFKLPSVESLVGLFGLPKQQKSQLKKVA
jgi:hypothetical protein